MALTRTQQDMQEIQEANYNPDVKKNDVTPIQKHSMEGNHDAVNWLLNAGCDPKSAIEGYKSSGDFERAEKMMSKYYAVKNNNDTNLSFFQSSYSHQSKKTRFDLTDTQTIGRGIDLLKKR